jgi:four helix bundle protein
MRDFHELKVWEKAHQLVLRIYQETKTFPKEEVYGITSQLRRAAASIPTNIAEGCGRFTSGDFRRSLAFAMGSASEVEYLLLLSRSLEMIEEADYRELDAKIIEIKKMLYSFSQTINSKP